MRFRALAAALAVALVATLPLAGVASAQADRDCADFSSQAEAQAALEARPGDPERLDGDHDGYACESLFGEVPGPPATSAPPTTTAAPPTTTPPTTTSSSSAPPTTVVPVVAPATTTATPAPPLSAVTTSAAPTTTATIIAYTPAGQVRLVPQGGVESGDGTLIALCREGHLGVPGPTPA